MKSFIFSIFFFSFATIGFAQEESDAPKEHQVPKLILRTNMLTVINMFKQSASLTADYRLAPRISIDGSFGYFFHNGINRIREEGESYRGPQFRLGAKYFFYTKNSYPFYFGMEAKHNRINHYEWGNLLRQGGQYGELALIHRQVHTWGGAFRLGGLLYLDRSKNFILDIYGGLGFNQRTVKDDIPEDAERLTVPDRFFNFLYPNGVTTVPALIIGLHFGYAFW